MSVVKFLTVCLVSGVVLLTAACQSGPKTVMLPMTPDLIEEVGPENMQKFSYYLSKDIQLMRQVSGRENVMFQEGVGIRVDKQTKDVLVIDKATPGFATKNMLAEAAHINYRLLGIEFEEESDHKIGFAAILADPEGRFEILFDNEDFNEVRYAGQIYRVIYSGSERPYLMVKMTSNLVQEDIFRSASGRKIQ